MSLPPLSMSTFRRICPEEVFCDTEPARRFLADTLVMLEDTNPLIFAFLHKTAFGKSAAHLLKEARFDAANCAGAIYRMYEDEATLPVVSNEIYDAVVREAEDPDFNIKVLKRTDVPPLSCVIAICTANYIFGELFAEAYFVQKIALMVYRMFELQSEQTAA